MTLVRTYDSATAQSAARYVLQIFTYPAQIWRNRYMVYNFLRRDIMGRFHGSVLGWYWLLMQPLVQFALYFFVFGILFGDPRRAIAASEHFALYLFSGVIAFYALIESTTQCCSIVVDNGNLVKKVAFPSEVLPVHVAITSAVLYLVGASVLVVIGLLLGAIRPGLLILALPLVLAVQVVFTLGIGLLLASVNVFLRDTTQIWRIVTMAWMFLTPVFWPPATMLGKFGGSPLVPGLLFGLNPAYPLLQAHRIALGVADPEGVPLQGFWMHLGTAASWAAFFLLIGYVTFASRKHKFADIV